MLQETFQWNGITSKKKGQKWGKEKLPYRRNDYKESNHEHSEMITAEKVKPLNDPIDFDKLAPFIGSPKVGFIYIRVDARVYVCIFTFHESLYFSP